MIERKSLQTIIESAINAPSGANSQPWSFSLSSEQTILIQIYPEKDHSILNHRKRGTLIALGALIENIEHVAHARSLSVEIGKFNEKDNTVLLRFTEDGQKQQCPLDGSIVSRGTNRKQYDPKQLPEDVQSSILSALSSDQVRGYIVTETEKRTAAAKACALFERLMVENDALRKVSFSEIVWGKGDERADHSGLHIDTLELIPPQRFILKLLQTLPIAVSAAKLLKLPSVIESDSAKLYASGPLIGILATPNNTDDSYIEVGRIFERVWLQATALGLSLQPMIGTLFLKQYIDASDETFSEAQRNDITKAYQSLFDVFSVEPAQTIAVAFRIGYAPSPTTTTQKAAPRITYT